MRRRCPMPTYAMKSQCEGEGFLEYDTGQVGKNALITNRTGADMIRGLAAQGDGPGAETRQTYDISADPMIEDIWPLNTVIQQPAAEAEPFRDVFFCRTRQCAGICGAREDECTDGVAVPDMTGAATADVWYTTDGFSSATATATDPFAVSEAIASGVCVKIDKDTWRWIVVRGTTDAGNPCEIGYSDDSGATWTNVNVGTTNGEFAVHGGAMHALDMFHIWLCTDGGLVYFSDDGGLTWTDLEAATPTPAEELFAVHFIDEHYGMAVGGTTGASGVCVWTEDGGDNWELLTAPAAAIIAGVAVINNQRVWVTTEAGALYYTDDQGQNWTARTVPLSSVNALGDVDFFDEFAGAICGNSNVSAADYGVILRTFDGGYSWESYAYGTAFDGALEYYGMNAVWMCSYNEVVAVGEPEDSLGVIMHLQAPGV
jgi:photosystem II stability/assembly factor-like uncharacterized protein